MQTQLRNTLNAALDYRNKLSAYLENYDRHRANFNRKRAEREAKYQQELEMIDKQIQLREAEIEDDYKKLKYHEARTKSPSHRLNESWPRNRASPYRYRSPNIQAEFNKIKAAREANLERALIESDNRVMARHADVFARTGQQIQRHADQIQALQHDLQKSKHYQRSKSSARTRKHFRSSRSQRRYKSPMRKYKRYKRRK